MEILWPKEAKAHWERMTEQDRVLHGLIEIVTDITAMMHDYNHSCLSMPPESLLTSDDVSRLWMIVRYRQFVD